MTDSIDLEVNPENKWRLNTPGSAGWERSVEPGSSNKHYILSADTHAVEPMTLWADRIDAKFRDRLPRQEVKDGRKYLVREGARPMPVQDVQASGEDAYRLKPPVEVDKRLADMDRDGIDHEVLFPNRGSLMYATHDPEFAHAQFSIYNEWIWETYGQARPDRFSPAAVIFTGDIPTALAEIKHAAELGFRIVNLPTKPVFGPHDPSHINYNLPEFDPMWALIQEAGLAITIHVGTGTDPRTAKGNGGAVVNYAVHALVPAAEPVANLCASGVLDRFPSLRFATIEAGIGWVPWFLRAMDEAYLKHHFWVKPKLKHGLPSEYYKAHGASTFSEDPIGLRVARDEGLVSNFFWASDYPHHEGTFPHSAPAIERQMGHLTDAERAKILGLNAARFFGVEVPARFAGRK